MITVAVLGCGKWGKAFACAIADLCTIRFWDKNSEAATSAATNTPNATAELSLPRAINNADLIIVGVSSSGFTTVLTDIRQTTTPFVWLTKGFAPETNQPLSTVAAHLFGTDGRYAVIAGPSFAEEVSAGLPTALTLAANRKADGTLMYEILNRKNLRLYLANDIIGVEVGGAVKNVIAIAAGICDGMQLGDNARCALITRGLAEMTALGVALGGQTETFMGLTGVGDLTLTCSSDKSRNRRLGLAIGANPHHVHTSNDVAALTTETCEGVVAIRPIMTSAAALQIRMPIITAIADVVGGVVSPAATVNALLSTPPHAAG